MCLYAQIEVNIGFLIWKLLLIKYNLFSIPITSTTAKPNVSSKSLEEDFNAAFNTGVDSSKNKTKTTSSLEKTLSRWDSPTTLKKF